MAYISQNDNLREFYEFDATPEGIQQAIENRQKMPLNRQLLVRELIMQYEGLETPDAVTKNIQLLLDENTFTICTAHQPNLFTGHLYFIYKIIHVIKLANTLKKDFPQYHFVPVFFMGSEDADLAELNHIELEGIKYEWKTKQKGAVGRMFVDKELIQLIGRIEGRLLAEPKGSHIAGLLKECFKINTTIERATFLFVHQLFKHYGLIVFLPDNKTLKKEMIPVFEEDIFKNTSEKIISDTSGRLSKHYHAQAFARDINLFYMKDDIRNRIVQSSNHYTVHDTDISFTETELRSELNKHPERFSPNVILRGIFQERILPDIVFIGGGGELAYWLQLKDLFAHYKTAYPVLFLRNSFLIEEKKWVNLKNKLSLTNQEIFLPQEQLFQSLVMKSSTHQLTLDKEKLEIEQFYTDLASKAGAIDRSLIDHIQALKAKQLKVLTRVEKKFMNAEKKNNTLIGNQVGSLLKNLFPGGGLQERTENFMLLYSRWGERLFEVIYEASPVYRPAFTIIEEN